MSTPAKLPTANSNSNANTALYTCNFGDYGDVIFFTFQNSERNSINLIILPLTCYKGQRTCVIKRKISCMYTAKIFKLFLDL